MSAAGCDYVSRYLERFLDEGVRGGVDLEQVSAHVGACAGCWARLSHFFRTIELPESGYLRETIDELALAFYNLAKAIIRDRPPEGPGDATETVRITEEGGGSEAENVEAGQEMIADAEDFTGSSSVLGLDLDDLREQLQEAGTARELKVEMALRLFRRITGMKSRYLEKAWNWIGVLHYQKGDLGEAEAAFLKVLAASDGAREVRSFAHCNLAYVFKHRGDLDRAIRSAERSVVLSEEDGKDLYFGRFAELYFRVLRGSPADLNRARDLLGLLTATRDGRDRLLQDLATGANAPVRDSLAGSALAPLLPELGSGGDSRPAPGPSP